MDDPITHSQGGEAEVRVVKEEPDPTPKQAFNDVAFWKVPHAKFDLDEALAVVGKGGGAASASAAVAATTPEDGAV